MKISRKIILTTFIILKGGSVLAQNSKNNSIYFEALGNGIAYSVNYDKLIPITSKLKFAPRVGFEFIPRDKSTLPANGKWTIPLEINSLYAASEKQKNFYEAGLGLTLSNIVENYSINENNEIKPTRIQNAKIVTLRLGYRYQKASGGLMYRAGVLVKLYQDEYSKQRVGDDMFFAVWPGFSVGYSF